VTTEREERPTSDPLLLDIVEFLPDATFVLDASKRVIAWNRAIEEMTGTQKEDILDRSDYAWAVPWYGERRPILVDLLWPENAAWADRYDFVHRQGDTLYAEVFVPRLHGGSGAYIWVTASPLCDAAGNLVGAIESVRDITDRKRAEQALRESEERYRALYADIPSMYFTVDAAGTVLSVNTFGASQLGYTVDELVGGSVLRVFPPDQQADATAHVDECLAHPGEVFIWELRKVRKDGSLLDVRETARAVPDRQGGLIVLIVCEDVTERRMLEEQLRQSQKMEAIGRLAGGVAHDFNNLLTAIRGFAELHLADHPLGDAGRADVLEIERAAERATQLTAGLLAFARRAEGHPTPLDLAAIVRDAMALLRRLVGEDIIIRLDADPEVPLVLADPVQIEQVLLNLAANASTLIRTGSHSKPRIATVTELTVNASASRGARPEEANALDGAAPGPPAASPARQRSSRPFARPAAFDPKRCRSGGDADRAGLSGRPGDPGLSLAVVLRWSVHHRGGQPGGLIRRQARVRTLQRGRHGGDQGRLADALRRRDRREALAALKRRGQVTRGRAERLRGRVHRRGYRVMAMVAVVAVSRAGRGSPADALCLAVRVGRQRSPGRRRSCCDRGRNLGGLVRGDRRVGLLNRCRHCGDQGVLGDALGRSDRRQALAAPQGGEQVARTHAQRGGGPAHRGAAAFGSGLMGSEADGAYRRRVQLHV
jgi:PAS domain S-box-containing protein